MDEFVTSKLIEWQLLGLMERFRDEAIDEESFGYLDLHTISTLIPRIGERLKFIKKYNEFCCEIGCSRTFNYMRSFRRHFQQHENVEEVLGVSAQDPVQPEFLNAEGQPAEEVEEWAATISEERAVQCSEWLKNNSQPLAQVEAYMCDTCQYRAGWIRTDHSKSIPEVLAEFPRLTTPCMIAQDFSILYGEAAPKLFETWVPLYAHKIIRLAKREGKLSVPEEHITQAIRVYIDTHNCPPTDARGEVSLTLLPVMLPPPVYKQGRKLVWASIEECVTA
ncbi:hypothetical protein ABVT39_001222 [Epinephelus coioides]